MKKSFLLLMLIAFGICNYVDAQITLLSEGFEGETSFTTSDEDADGKTWGVVNTPGLPRSGSNCMAVDFNPAGNNDWLITPTLDLPTDEEISFSFYAMSVDSAFLETFDIYIIAAGQAEWGLYFFEIDVPATYTEFTYDLSDWAGESVNIAIVCSSIDRFMLTVDDILVESTGNENSTEVYLNNIAFTSQVQEPYEYGLPETMTMHPYNPENWLSPGWPVRFKLSCFNNKTLGTNIVSGLCEVKTTDPYITLIKSTSGLNNVGWSESAWSTDEFEIEISPNAPFGYVARVDFLVAEGTEEYYTYDIPIPISPLGLQSRTIDDDANPDSNGNGNSICEPGETIETFPTLQNKSSLTANIVSGKFFNYYGYSGITVWNDTAGASGTVVNSSFWNYAFGSAQPIDAGATDMVPQFDFVFDYNFPAVYSFDMIIALSGNFQLFEGIQSIIKWAAVMNFNEGSPAVPATSIDTRDMEESSLEIMPNPSNGIFSFELKNQHNQDLRIDIFNNVGALVFSSELKNINGFYRDEIDLSGEPAGMYIMSITGENLSKTRKLIIRNP